MKTCPICKVPKPLTDYNHYFSKQRGKIRLQSYCKDCEPEEKKRRSAEYFEKHKAERLQYSRDYRNKNKEAINRKRPIYKRKQIEELQNCYVREILITRNNIHPELISPELLETKRAMMKLKRTLKSIRNEK